MKKPKLKDFSVPNDLTGEKAYSAYRKAKNLYIAEKRAKLNKTKKS